MDCLVRPLYRCSLSAALSCCWTCQIYMIDLTKFCSGGCSQQPTRQRFRRKRKESEGRYSTPSCRQKTEDARWHVCGNVRKQISHMCRAAGGSTFYRLTICLSSVRHSLVVKISIFTSVLEKLLYLAVF